MTNRERLSVMSDAEYALEVVEKVVSLQEECSNLLSERMGGYRYTIFELVNYVNSSFIEWLEDEAEEQ